MAKKTQKQEEQDLETTLKALEKALKAIFGEDAVEVKQICDEAVEEEGNEFKIGDMVIASSICNDETEYGVISGIQYDGEFDEIFYRVNGRMFDSDEVRKMTDEQVELYFA